MKIIRKFAVITAAACLFIPSAGMPQKQAEAAAEHQGITAVYADGFGDVLSGAQYSIMVRLNGKFVTAAADGNVHQWDSLGDSTQDWQIIRTEDGCCKIVSASDPTMALTVDGGDAENGRNIYLSAYEASDAQHFILHRTDDAYYITAKCSGKAALDVYDISYENGANINQWDYWGGEGQKFYLRPLEKTYKVIRGDLNGDGSLCGKDLTLLKRGILHGFDAVAAQIADCNGDGLVNEADVILLQDGLLGSGYEFINDWCEIAYEKPATAYLFAYFLGNNPDQERLSYAVSLDGYHFNALNNGAAVWQSGVGTGCIRDPYIFLGEDGLYHMLATDMKSSLGWSSNRNLISAKSTDLVHWFDESLIEIANQYPNMMGADRAWAPQAIYDPNKDSYMIYFAARVPGIDDRTIMYYAYSKDLKTLDTAPQLLFAPVNGNDAIDSDIIYQNGKYYMYYKNETNKRIYLAIADQPSGPYKEIKQISEGNLGVEGPNIYPVIGTNEWLMMSDAYGNGYYVMQKTTDLENFTGIDRGAYSFDFTPRHGYVIPINDDQYGALVSAYPSATIQPRNTGMESVRLQFAQGETPVMPETVQATYSDGGTMDFAVSWNENDLAAINTSQAGTYTVSGTVLAADYDNPIISERADPHIIYGEDGYYYFTASYPAYGNVNQGYDRIILRRSPTVAGLATAEEITVWNAHPSGIMAKHIWAPEMHKINGVWYIYFAAGSSSDIWAIRPYVLRCSGDPFTGTWTECGQMQSTSGDTGSFRSFSLDMTYFEQDGKHYVIWAEIKGDSSLFMAEVNPNEPWKLTSAPILLTKPEYPWELVNHRVNEGASVLKTKDKIYIFFSASGTGSEYCVGRMEADLHADLMNISNWSKLDHPVLSTANMNGESGPGHNSFVVDENGNTLIVFHARPASHLSKSCGTYAADPLYDPCRHTHIKQVYFDANGVPIVCLKENELLASRYRTVTAVITIQ